MLGLWPQPVIDAAKGDIAVVEKIVGAAKERAARAGEKPAVAALR
jgi:hypothetical protein